MIDQSDKDVLLEVARTGYESLFNAITALQPLVANDFQAQIDALNVKVGELQGKLDAIKALLG
jgi:hypothetical protein